MSLRHQIILTITFLPVSFGIWFASSSVWAAPAVWACDFIATIAYPEFFHQIGLQESVMVVHTNLGATADKIGLALETENQIILELDTRLVSYSVAFYASLLLASNIESYIFKFCLGLFILWAVMAVGLLSMLGREFLILTGPLNIEFLNNFQTNLLLLIYQFSVLLAPPLMPSCVWVAQLRGSPLWRRFTERIPESSRA